ncbi:MAG: alpha/beta hydrolase [Promicromonosporaceae bacterium]|nr:alpha/beta hydrolase [Promicromonosporaceae bacterium]
MTGSTDQLAGHHHDSAEFRPLVPDTDGRARRLVGGLLGATIGVTLWFSPRPAALLLRRIFRASGQRQRTALERHAPAGIGVVADERYGDHADMLLDVYRPEAADGALPLVVWIHGGAWVGGAKEEVSGYAKRLAAAGHVVVAPAYSLAPEHRYPTPVRQLAQALDFVQANADRFGVDTDRIVIAGDSAGAHLAAQLAALVTTPGYADRVGIRPALDAARLRGLVLACGPFDATLAREASSPAGRHLITTALWAYTGTRHFLDAPAARDWSIPANLSPAYPPALVTVGNADPLALHTERLVNALRDLGAEPETVLWPDDHVPPLGHEYQFDLDGEAGQVFLERLLAFLARTLGARQPEPAPETLS